MRGKNRYKVTLYGNPCVEFIIEAEVMRVEGKLLWLEGTAPNGRWGTLKAFADATVAKAELLEED